MGTLSEFETELFLSISLQLCTRSPLSKIIEGNASVSLQAIALRINGLANLSASIIFGTNVVSTGSPSPGLK
jgi:hypothetical protein